MSIGGALVTGVQTVHDGGAIHVRADKQGGTVVSNLHGKYYDAARRKRLFYSQVNAVAMSAPATTALGNIVWNPPDSGIVLALGKWSLMCQVTDANALIFQLGYSAQLTLPATTLAATVGCGYLGAVGSAPGVAKGYAATTLTTAVTPIYTMAHITAAIALTGEDQLQGDFDGGIIVPPGNVVHVCCVVAAAAAGVTSTLWWEEIPI